MCDKCKEYEKLQKELLKKFIPFVQFFHLLDLNYRRFRRKTIDYDPKLKGEVDEFVKLLKTEIK